MPPRHNPKKAEDLLVAITLCIVLASFMVGIALLFTGCVSAPVAPNLKFPEAQACPKLSLPPIPQKVYLSIDGDKVQNDAGGDVILRGYARCHLLYP